LDKYGSITIVAKVFRLNLRQLYKWKELKNNYPLRVLSNLAENVNLSLELEYIKTKKDSDVLRKPKVIIKENLELVEFIGHLLHDGGIDKQYAVHYTTHSEIYAKRFEKLVSICFGELVVDRRIEKNKVTLYYPVILGYILEELFKIPRGSKVVNDVMIPRFILKSSKNKKWIYVITAYLCDGIKNRVAITASSKSISRPPQLLNGLKIMLNSLGIQNVSLKESYIYQTKSSLHRAWILRVLDKHEKNIFKSHLDKVVASTAKDPE